MQLSMGKFALVALGLLGLIALLPLSSNSLLAISNGESFLAQVFTGDATNITACQQFCEGNSVLQMQACQLPDEPPAEEMGAVYSSCLEGVRSYFQGCSLNCQQGLEAAIRSENEVKATAAEAQRQAKIEQAEQNLEKQLELRTELLCTQSCEEKANSHYVNLKAVGTDERLARNDAQNTYDTCLNSCRISQKAAPVIDNQTGPVVDQASADTRTICVNDCAARLETWKKECGTNRSCVDNVKEIYEAQCLPGCYGFAPNVSLPKLQVPPILGMVESEVGTKVALIIAQPILLAPADEATLVTSGSPLPSRQIQSSRAVLHPAGQAPVVSLFKGIVETVVDFFKGIFGSSSDDASSSKESVTQTKNTCPAPSTMNTPLTARANVKKEGGAVPTTQVAGSNPVLSKVVIDANTLCKSELRKTLATKAQELANRACPAACSASYELTDERMTGCDISSNPTVQNYAPSESAQGVWKDGKGTDFFYAARALGNISATFTSFCGAKTISGAVNQGSAASASAAAPILPAGTQFEIIVNTKDSCANCADYTDAEGFARGNKALWYTSEGEKIYFKRSSPVEAVILSAIKAKTIKGLSSSAVTVAHRHADEAGCFTWKNASACVEKLWGQLPRIEVRVTSGGALITSSGQLYPHLSGGMNSVINAIKDILADYGISQ